MIAGGEGANPKPFSMEISAPFRYM